MQESKIQLTERWRREGRWGEASAYKDATLKRLRAEGMKGVAARDKAWELTALAFPEQQAVKPTCKSVEASEYTEEWTCAELRALVDDWAAKYSLVLSAEAAHEMTTHLVNAASMLGWLTDEPTGYL